MYIILSTNKIAEYMKPITNAIIFLYQTNNHMSINYHIFFSCISMNSILHQEKSKMLQNVTERYVLFSSA